MRDGDTNWRLDVDRRKVKPAALQELGWEIVCLLEDLERAGAKDGVVQMEAVEGLPATKFAVRVLEGDA